MFQTHTLPATIPTLREWNSGQDTFVLTPSSRLIVTTEEFLSAAQTAQQDLHRLIARALPIVTGGEPEDGDIVLAPAGADPTLGSEGYSLDIARHVEIKAHTASGVFYGLQTIQQLLQQDPAHGQLPAGTARDYPAFVHRALMLDLARKYWSVDYLKALMRTMARFKLNMLHLHFNDWNAFRLQSEQYPGLAAKLSYSKADLAELQAAADQYHIMLIPEIDLPAHATAITRYDPTLALTCDCMSRSRWPGGELGGWTINYADPTARQWMKNLLHEFVPLFSSPQFHIGCDEVPDGDLPATCPELVTYARAQGYPYPGDVLVEWINEANELVRSYGKLSQLWAWWERTPHSLEPDRDIIVNSWVEKQEPDQFLEAGYQVVCTREDTHYITPTLGLQPDNKYLYDLWKPNPHPNVLGYKLCVWADNMENCSDAFFTPLLKHPLAILSERLWAGDTPSRPLSAFLDLLNTGFKESLDW